MKQRVFDNPDVALVFDAYPKVMKDKLLLLRHLIFKVAAETQGVGDVEETLKWGSPSYLTTATKSGTTLRIDQRNRQEGKYAIRVHCQTNLIDQFQEIHGDKFTYDGNRGIILDERDEVPTREISDFIFLALTYHLRKKREVVREAAV